MVKGNTFQNGFHEDKGVVSAFLHVDMSLTYISPITAFAEATVLSSANFLELVSLTEP